MQIAHANAAQAQVMVLHDIRAVHDIASLGWLIPPMSKSRWVIARIEPATGSGAGTVPGGYIDGATGKFVAPPNASPVTIRKGTWTLIGGGSEAPGKARPYDWTQPVQQPGRAETVVLPDLPWRLWRQDDRDPLIGRVSRIFWTIGQRSALCGRLAVWLVQLRRGFEPVSTSSRTAVENWPTPRC